MARNVFLRGSGNTKSSEGATNCVSEARKWTGGLRTFSLVKNRCSPIVLVLLLLLLLLLHSCIVAGLCFFSRGMS